jgi:fatty-acyl-CoA synthase
VDTRANTVDGVVRRSARRTPDRTALVFADRSWIYRELDEATDRTAGWLRTLGVVQGDRVATDGQDSDASVLREKA